MIKIHKFRRTTRIIMIAGDLIYIPIIYILSYWIRSKTSLALFQEKMPIDRFLLINHRLWLLMFLHITLLYFHGLYDQMHTHHHNQVIHRIFRVVSLEILILVAVYFFSQDILFPRSILLLLWFLIMITAWAWHYLWYRIYKRHLPKRNVLIVGVNDTTRELLREIARLSTYGLEIIGILDETHSDPATTEFQGYPILGTREDLLQIVEKYKIDEVVISTSGSWQEKMVDQISRTDQIPARICVIPTCYEILIGKINHLRLYDIPLIEVIKQPHLPAGKRAGDFILALLLFILCFPLFLMSALAVWIASGRPILFKQERIGKNRIPFTIYKFRTMIEGAEDDTGPILSKEKDNRITRIGYFLRKYRLDELPQLINILKGEMSFVGPRPERAYFIEQFLDRVPGYGERFKATPGLTGLAQVNGGYATTPENKLKYDLAYIYNQSLWLDIRILLETIKVILAGRVNP